MNESDLCKSNNGLHPYQGYEYQILATVWVALYLILHRNCCDEIVVEPASGEDVAAKLKVAPEKANSTLKVQNKHIEIQIKLRRSGHWTPSEFRKVLQEKGNEKGNRGPQKRIRPLSFLRSYPDSKFILITNAQVNSELHPYIISKIGEQSDALTIPGKPAKKDTPEFARRIGILPQYESQRLMLEIDQILRLKGHLPSSRFDKALDVLKKSVRLRLLGTSNPIWTKQELIRSIQEVGGFPRIERDDLVKPLNYDEIQTQLSQKYKLLLSGPPGTGKTFLAKHLVYLHSIDRDPFEVVTEEKGIGFIRECLDRDDRFLFFLSDPWGVYRIASDADKWTNDLPKLLCRASNDKRFIITSRIGIKDQAMGDADKSEFAAAEVQLTEAHYDAQKQIQILKNAMKESKPWQHDIVRRHYSHITSTLRVPYSLVVFANRLSNIVSENAVNIDELIKQSNMETIGSSLAQEIRGMGEEGIASAIVLWTFMMNNLYVNEKQMRVARRLVTDIGYKRPIDPLKMFRWLLKARWLQPSPKGFIGHSIVLDGLESLFDQEPSLSEAVLFSLLKGLIADNQVAAAHKILKQLKGRKLPIPEAVQNAINLYLVDSLRTVLGYNFRDSFNEVAEWSTADDELSILVRILTKTEKIQYLGYKWVATEMPNSNIAKIAHSDDARECAVKFINEILPTELEIEYEAADLVPFFDALGWDMSETFASASETALEKGNPKLDVLVEGALFHDTRYGERLLNSTLKAYDEVNNWWQEFSRTEYRKAIQAEVNAQEANFIFEEPSERFYASETALKIIVSSRRKSEGYKWLQEHPRSTVLLKSWVEAVEQSVSRSEVESIIRVCPVQDQRLAWNAIQQGHCLELVDCIIMGLADSPFEHLKDCLESLCKLLNLDQWKDLVLPALGSLSFVRRAALWDIAKKLDESIVNHSKQIISLIGTALSSAEYDCMLACHNVESQNANSRSMQISENCKALLRNFLETGPDELAIRAAFVLVNAQEDFEKYLPHLLKSDDYAVRINAVRLASILQSKRGNTLLRACLNDLDYRCRREAMWAFAPTVGKKDKILIMAKAIDPSAPVREACAEIIGKYKWKMGETTLIKLLADRRDSSQDMLMQFHIPRYHVARAAALALSEIGQLSRSSLDSILLFIEKRNAKKDDIVVYYNLLSSLALQNNDCVLPVLENFLEDAWHMPGIKFGGFPLRYAAAWGIIEQLGHKRSLINVVNLESLYRGTVHTDSRLAGPSLFLLGLIGKRAQDMIIHALQAESMTANRALIILAAISGECQFLRATLKEFIGSGHAALRIYALARNKPNLNNKDWINFLDKNKGSVDWIQSIQSSDDVNPVLRYVFYHNFRDPINTSFSNHSDLRIHDLADSFPVVTMRSMFGGE